MDECWNRCRCLGVTNAFYSLSNVCHYRTLVHYGWCTDYSKKFRDLLMSSIPLPLRAAVHWRSREKIRGYLNGHGIGRHSVQEIYRIAEQDLRAVSSILGEKKFLFGNKPCLADAALFALVCNFIWQMPQCPQGRLILAELGNLEEHSKTMKEAFYPDWDEVVKKKDR